MKFPTLLTINAVLGLVYGIAFVLVPSTVLSIYGITTGPGELLMSQFFGVALLALGLMSWFIRNVIDSSAQRAVVLSALIADVVGVIVSLMGTLSGVMNSVGWTSVAIYFLLALGFASLQFRKPTAS